MVSLDVYDSLILSNPGHEDAVGEYLGQLFIEVCAEKAKVRVSNNKVIVDMPRPSLALIKTIKKL